jgi:hypothetical protein
VRAHQPQDIAQADALIEEVRALAAKPRSLTAKAEEEGDLRTALMGLREIARILELRARVAGEIGAVPINIDITPFSIDQLNDEQAEELSRKLDARRLDRLISPEEQARIRAAIEEQMLARVLDDPKRRERLRARLAPFDTTKH